MDVALCGLIVAVKRDGCDIDFGFAFSFSTESPPLFECNRGLGSLLLQQSLTPLPVMFYS